MIVKLIIIASAEYFAFHGHGFSLLAENPPLRGLQTRGTALSFVPSKTFCFSHRTRKASKHYIARRKLFFIFEESSYSAYARIDSTTYDYTFSERLTITSSACRESRLFQAEEKRGDSCGS